MWRFAIQNLISRPVRSLLALAGLSVAITGMVGLFSVAEGINRMVSETFSRIPGLAIMQAGAPLPLFSRMPAAWGDEIESMPGVRVVNPEVWTRVNVMMGERVIAPPRFLFGTGIAAREKLKADVYRDAMVEGRFLNASDRGQLHAVISRQIAEDHDVGVGEELAVNGDPLEIVGIYHCGQLMLDVSIILDIDVVRRLNRFDRQSVCAFYVEPDGTVEDQVLVNKIRERFRGREVKTSEGIPGVLATGHPLIDLLLAIQNWLSARGDPLTSPPVHNDPEAEPIEVRTASDWGERFKEFSADLNLFLSVMTGIGVVIAVLSIINTMLMSVTERIVEFGILKANGWNRRDVMLLITCESAVLGVTGGIIGCLLGLAGTSIVNSTWPDRLQLYASPSLLIFSFFFSTFLGISGGLYPATWAMKLSPMEAIRRG
ncbi:MAG: ABC transporter permease [Planctomycetaceae bacterium]|jgi:putative ABC transport system permease protein|nr:ABC transporter permease [Planctomycetaceae bacterium]MDP7276296.1 ABC transporter permease [Planctomycetaceae bacterium]